MRERLLHHTSSQGPEVTGLAGLPYGQRPRVLTLESDAFRAQLNDRAFEAAGGFQLTPTELPKSKRYPTGQTNEDTIIAFPVEHQTTETLGPLPISQELLEQLAAALSSTLEGTIDNVVQEPKNPTEATIADTKPVGIFRRSDKEIRGRRNWNLPAKAATVATLFAGAAALVHEVNSAEPAAAQDAPPAEVCTTVDFDHMDRDKDAIISALAEQYGQPPYTRHPGDDESYVGQHIKVKEATHQLCAPNDHSVAKNVEPLYGIDRAIDDWAKSNAASTTTSSSTETTTTGTTVDTTPVQPDQAGLVPSGNARLGAILGALSATGVGITYYFKQLEEKAGPCERKKEYWSEGFNGQPTKMNELEATRLPREYGIKDFIGKSYIGKNSIKHYTDIVVSYLKRGGLPSDVIPMTISGDGELTNKPVVAWANGDKCYTAVFSYKKIDGKIYVDRVHILELDKTDPRGNWKWRPADPIPDKKPAPKPSRRDDIPKPDIVRSPIDPNILAQGLVLAALAYLYKRAGVARSNSDAVPSDIPGLYDVLVNDGVLPRADKPPVTPQDMLTFLMANGQIVTGPNALANGQVYNGGELNTDEGTTFFVTPPPPPYCSLGLRCEPKPLCSSVTQEDGTIDPLFPTSDEVERSKLVITQQRFSGFTGDSGLRVLHEVDTDDARRKCEEDRGKAPLRPNN